MRQMLVCGGLVAVVLAQAGCRSHVAGNCDCTNHPESAVVAPPANPYPVVNYGPPATAPAAPAAPAAMPAPEKMPPPPAK